MKLTEEHEDGCGQLLLSCERIPRTTGASCARVTVSCLHAATLPSGRGDKGTTGGPEEDNATTRQ